MFVAAQLNVNLLDKGIETHGRMRPAKARRRFTRQGQVGNVRSVIGMFKLVQTAITEDKPMRSVHKYYMVGYLAGGSVNPCVNCHGGIHPIPASMRPVTATPSMSQATAPSGTDAPTSDAATVLRFAS